MIHQVSTQAQIPSSALVQHCGWFPNQSIQEILRSTMFWKLADAIQLRLKRKLVHPRPPSDQTHTLRSGFRLSCSTHFLESKYRWIYGQWRPSCIQPYLRGPISNKLGQFSMAVNQGISKYIFWQWKTLDESKKNDFIHRHNGLFARMSRAHIWLRAGVVTW